MNPIELILEEKGHAVHTVASGASVLEAVSMMCVLHVGALVVMAGPEIVGIFSERDLMSRVVLAGLEPATTTVRSVMSRRVLNVNYDASPHEVMNLMTKRRIRHVPVMRDGSLVGLVSIGDLVRWTIRDRDSVISQLNDYVTGRYPG